MVRNNENNVFSCILVILCGFGHFQHFWFSMTTIILKSILKTFAFEIDMNRVYFFLYYVIYINRRKRQPFVLSQQPFIATLRIETVYFSYKCLIRTFESRI